MGKLAIQRRDAESAEISAEKAKHRGNSARGCAGIASALAVSLRLSLRSLRLCVERPLLDELHRDRLPAAAIAAAAHPAFRERDRRCRGGIRARIAGGRARAGCGLGRGTVPASLRAPALLRGRSGGGRRGVGLQPDRCAGRSHGAAIPRRDVRRRDPHRHDRTSARAGPRPGGDRRARWRRAARC